MPLLDVDSARGTFDHWCQVCGPDDPLVRKGLHLDPAAGDLSIRNGCIAVRPCPQCASEEMLNITHLPHDAGEGPQPGSLVGLRFPDPAPHGSVVSEHWVGTHANPERQQQCRLIRAIQQHPLVAPHAPLHEYVLLGAALDHLAASLAHLR